jgi:hypothetical protein
MTCCLIADVTPLPNMRKRISLDKALGKRIVKLEEKFQA